MRKKKKLCKILPYLWVFVVELKKNADPFGWHVEFMEKLLGVRVSRYVNKVSGSIENETGGWFENIPFFFILKRL